MTGGYGESMERFAQERRDNASWEPLDSSPEPGEGFRAGDYLEILKKRKWLILLAGVVGAGLAFGVFLRRPPVFTAHSTMEVFGRNENFMNFSQVDPQAGIGLYSPTASNLATQIQILRSASLLKNVIERLRLEKLPPVPQDTGLIDRLRQKLGILTADSAANSRAALSMAVKTFRPGVVRETRIIEIQCQSSSPAVAALFLNTLADEFVDQTLASRTVSSGRTSEWLTNQLAEAKNRLEFKEKRLADFTRATGYVAVAPEETLSGAKLRQLREDLSTVQSERIQKQANWERLSGASPDALAALVDDAQLRSNQTALSELRKQLANLRTTFTAAHPQVQKLTAQIAEAQRVVDEDRKGVLDRAKLDYDTVVKQERLLTSAYSRQTGAVSGESRLAAPRHQLQREVEAALQTYNGLLQQVNQASMAAAVPSEYVRTIDRATADLTPEGLRLAPTVLLGFFSGLLLSAGVIVTSQAVIGTLRGSQSSSGMMNAPELAVIPPMALGGYGGKPLSSGVRLLGGGGGKPIPANGVAPAFWGGDSRSLYVESFRRAIASILMYTPGRQQCRVLVVTSAGPGEGKTMVTSNLGIAIAEAGRKVLLIDMDLRQPELHARFGAANGAGIAEVMLSGQDVSEGHALEGIQATGIPGLSILPASQVDPAKLSLVLYHHNWKPLIARLRTEYDFILIDTPPASAFSDGRALGTLSDGVILVLRAGKTTRNAALDIRRQFEEDGTLVVGTILNDSMPEAIAEVYNRYYNRGETPN